MRQLSDLANYARDRNIAILFRGSSDGTLFFDIILPRDTTARVRQNLEKRLIADNEGCDLDIVYFSAGKEAGHVIL